MPETPVKDIASHFFTIIKSLRHQLDMNHPVAQMSLAQCEALRFICDQKQVTMKEVADFLLITPPSTTVLIENLVKLGFVQRSNASTDRRTILLTLTNSGKEVLKTAMKQRDKSFRKLLKNLSHTEQTQLLHILNKVS